MPIALLAWAATCGVLSVDLALFGIGVRWAWKFLPRPAWPWACAILWAALEFTSGRFFPYLGALPLAMTQWRYLSLIQGASWAGPQALSFLLVLVNGILALTFSGRIDDIDNTQRRNCAAGGRIALGLCLIWWGWGIWILSGRSMARAVAVRHVAILQPNVDQYRKWDASYEQEIRQDISELVDAASFYGRPDLVVWPESSYPGWLDEADNEKWLHNLLSKAKTYQLVGALTRYPNRRFNSAVLFGPDAQPIGEYNKRRLVPFGEFIPFRAVSSKVIGLLGEMGDLDAGSWVQRPLATPLGRLGITICYEALFPELNQWNAASGADILVNLTNDGWYKDSWGPYEHFYFSALRAVENRRPVIRAANTGVSGVIDPYGVVIARLDLDRRGALNADVPVGLFPDGSFYSRHGDWFGWFALLVTLAIVAINVLRTYETAR